LLVSPHPKETAKAIDSRKSQENKEEKPKNSDEYFKDNHINTTFLETLRQFGGEESVKGYKEIDPEFKENKVLMYKPDPEDEKVIKQLLEAKETNDEIEF
jgi:hypothetical protein